MSDDGTGGLIVLRWNYDPRAVGQARAELGKVLAQWRMEEVAEAATLVLSELLTNSLRHARVSGRLVETRFLRIGGEDGGGVRLEVHDASAKPPEVSAEPAADSCGGRGLLLVGAVADRWGVAARNGPGKCVWAECRVGARAVADAG